MYTIVYNCIQLYTCTQLIYIFYAGNVKHMGIQLGQDAAISSASLTNFSRRDASSGGPDRRRGVSAHLGLSEMAVHVGGLCQQPQPQGRGNKVMPKGPPWGLEYPVSWRRLIMGGQWPDQWICWVDEAAVLCHKDVDCKKPENGSGHNLPLDTACSWLLGQWFGAGPKSNGSTIYIYMGSIVRLHPPWNPPFL